MKVGETAAGLSSLRSWAPQSDLVAVTLLVVICYHVFTGFTANLTRDMRDTGYYNMIYCW